MIGQRDSIYGSRDPFVEVDLDAIGWNLSRIRKIAKVPVLAVVKANAYGHGLVSVAKYLEGQGATGLMVGKLSEALALREAGIRRPVFNFGPFGSDDARAVAEHDIVQSVFTDDVRAISVRASESATSAAVNIHIDSGMNRAGIPVDKALAFLGMVAGLPNIKIKGVSTTFTEEPEFDGEQLQRFLEVCEAARRKGIDCGLRHAASSAGLFSGRAFHLDMVRPGIALYGYYPNARTRKADALDLKPALRFLGRITFIRDIAAGETISYVRAYRAEKAMRVATVSAGYSDGYPPVLGGAGAVIIRDKRFPVLPAVTSNHIMVDLRNDSSIRVGDEVVLVDNRRDSGVSADALAEAGGISDYKILIGLNPLLPRGPLGVGPR